MPTPNSAPPTPPRVNWYDIAGLPPVELFEILREEGYTTEEILAIAAFAIAEAIANK